MHSETALGCTMWEAGWGSFACFTCFACCVFQYRYILYMHIHDGRCSWLSQQSLQSLPCLSFYAIMVCDGAGTTGKACRAICYMLYAICSASGAVGNLLAVTSGIFHLRNITANSIKGHDQLTSSKCQVGNRMDGVYQASHHVPVTHLFQQLLGATYETLCAAAGSSARNIAST
jgi:hypothetical protein